MFAQLANLPSSIKQYLIITSNYWAFTLTDGALRMLVVLYFHQEGWQKKKEKGIGKIKKREKKVECEKKKRKWQEGDSNKKG